MFVYCKRNSAPGGGRSLIRLLSTTWTFHNPKTFCWIDVEHCIIYEYVAARADIFMVPFSYVLMPIRSLMCWLVTTVD